MKKKRKQTKNVAARDWGIVNLINRRGGKGVHTSRKHPPRSTAKAAFKKSLIRNDSHEAFFNAHQWPGYTNGDPRNTLVSGGFSQQTLLSKGCCGVLA